MHQDVASQHLQRRVFGVWFAFSICLGAAPIASGLVLVLLRLCTNHVVVTLVLTVLLTRLALLMAQFTCVQSKNPQEALTIVVRQNLFLLPIASFILACLLTNSSTGQWLLRVVYKNQEVPASIFPLWWLTSSLRLFFAAFILGLLVVIRFYGPWSIMKMSTVPLPTNPSTRLVQRLGQLPWLFLPEADPQSSVSFLLRLLQAVESIFFPDQNQNGSNANYSAAGIVPAAAASTKSSTTNSSGTAIAAVPPIGRRFQRLTAQQWAQHIVFSLMAAAAVAFLTAIPILSLFPNGKGTPADGYTITLSCIVSTMTMLSFLFFGTSHEIDPLAYLKVSHIFSWANMALKVVLRRTLIVALVVPAFVMVSTAAVNFSLASFSIRSCTEVAIASGLIALYMAAVDETIRLKIFHDVPNMESLYREVFGNPTTETQLRVLLSSLLESKAMVEEVMSPSSHRFSNVLSLESQELKFTGHLMKLMVQSVYFRPSMMIEETLDDDLLRIVTLEWFGGTGQFLPSYNRRRESAVRRWMHDRSHAVDTTTGYLFQDTAGTPFQQQQQKLREPAATVLVRSLCVIIGGLGEALLSVSGIEPTKSSRPTNHHSSISHWTIAPGAFAAMELAVVALERFLIYSLAPSGHSPIVSLSTQIPSALHAMHLLRRGMLQYGSDSTAKGSPRGEREKCAKMARLCNSVATRVLLTLKNQNGLGRITAALEGDCLAWKNELVAQASH